MSNVNNRGFLPKPEGKYLTIFVDQKINYIGNGLTTRNLEIGLKSGDLRWDPEGYAKYYATHELSLFERQLKDEVNEDLTNCFQDKTPLAALDCFAYNAAAVFHKVKSNDVQRVTLEEALGICTLYRDLHKGLPQKWTESLRALLDHNDENIKGTAMSVLLPLQAARIKLAMDMLEADILGKNQKRT